MMFWCFGCDPGLRKGVGKQCFLGRAGVHDRTQGFGKARNSRNAVFYNAFWAELGCMAEHMVQK